ACPFTVVGREKTLPPVRMRGPLKRPITGQISSTTRKEAVNMNDDLMRDDMRDERADADLKERGAKNNAKGGMDKLTGKVQEAAGNLTGNDSMAAKGKMKQMKGGVEDNMGDAENTAGDVVNP
ncbi:MAG: CsbD family protein, partial [Ktedonobacterales bacterium]